MSQEIKKPAGGPVFGEVRGTDSNPQANHESFSQNCQENYGSADSLVEMFELKIRSKREIYFLRAIVTRLKSVAGGCA